MTADQHQNKIKTSKENTIENKVTILQEQSTIVIYFENKLITL